MKLVLKEYKFLVVYALLLIVTTAFFLLFPESDLIVARYFWKPDAGFYLKDTFIPHLFYKGIPILAFMIEGLIVAILLLRLCKCRFSLGLNAKEALFLLLSLALGPGLLVNAILKEYWGRARPVQIIEFNGHAHFTPPFILSDQCLHNCSFVAGHPALAFFTISFAFLIQNPAYRRMGEIAAIMFGCLAGYGRIVQGGHFLSDVVFSGLLVVGIAKLLHYLMIERKSI